jgi:acetylornithine deacetylase
MAELLSATLEHLAALVAFDTRNPPRRIDGGGLLGYARVRLAAAGCRCEFVDLGDGCVSLLAVRGDPRILFNVHIDTVPADPGWSADPLRLVIDGERAIGLGACDIKGALAGMLAALPGTEGPVALLLSSDEEAGSSRCVRAFLEKHRFDEVVVAEPTRGRAVLEHRGIGTATAVFSGIGGHASAARALGDSAVHEAVRWAGLALQHAAASEAAGEGLRLNVGAFEGGQKANMIAASATLRFGVRPPPGLAPEEALARLFALAPEPGRVNFVPGFLAPPLPAAGAEGLAAARASAQALADRLGVGRGAAVDFWTEAALFSAAGATALVFGPGDIAQAHTAGEWVALAELSACAEVYRRMWS